jgi:hypothetical protein
MSEQTQDLQQTQDTEAGAPIQLQLSDLLLCAQVIQLASQRGAFRAEEFTQVGGLFERLTSFLTESGALQSSSAPTSDETVATPAAE